MITYKHKKETDDRYLLGCDAFYVGRYVLVFRRNVLLPSPGQLQVRLKGRSVPTKLHSIVSDKTEPS